MDLPYDPIAHFWKIYPKEIKSAYEKDICSTFIATLFTIAKLRTRPRCLLTDNWVRKCGIHIQWDITQQ